MDYHRRNWLVPILFLLLLVACADLSASAPLPAPVPTAVPTATPVAGRGAGGVLRLLYWDTPEMLNPHLVKGLKNWEVSRITYEPLASYDAAGELVPFLAAEIPSVENGGVAADGRSVTWKLRQDVFWSDGEPFTADDVVFTYDFITNPEVAADSRSVYETVATVEALDSYTVKITFRDINPVWAVPFVGMRGVILPRHIFAPYNGSNARSAPANLIPVGTGPYRAVAFEPQEVLFLGTQLIQTNKIIFEPNPYFREADKPYFSRLEVNGGGTVEEAARQVLATGDVDYAWQLTLPPEELAGLEALGRGRLVVNFVAWVEQLALNRTDPNRETADGERSSLQFEHPFFSDLRVRQAFAHAVNRDEIAALYGSTGQATTVNLVAPPAFRSSINPYPYDPERARALLEEAGWVDSNNDGIRQRDGRRLRVVFQAPTGPLTQKTMAVIKENLEAVGVEVELKITEVGIFYSIDPGNPDTGPLFYVDMQEFSISSPNPDPGLYMGYWTCAQIPQKANQWRAGFNLQRWCNPTYDALYNQVQGELDPERRRELFIRMNDLLVEDVAMIPLVHLANISAVSRDLEGVAPTPWDAETWNIKDWRRASP